MSHEWSLDSPPDWHKEEACLLIVDVQEKLFPLVEHSKEMLNRLLTLIKGCKILSMPVVLCEQYPKGLGFTLPEILDEIENPEFKISKTSFSCVKEPSFEKFMHLKKQWIIAGIEAHVCIFQSARDLQKQGKQVVIIQDAVSSRSKVDYDSAIIEMRELSIRISTVETILFDLVKDASFPEFKRLMQLFK